MARVPLTGSFNMVGGTTGASATSIEEVLVYEFGYTRSGDFNDMVSFAKSNCIIENFSESVRPVSGDIDDIDSTIHFRGFPTPSDDDEDTTIVWHMKELDYINIT